MKIRIVKTNAEQIVAALAEVNGKATAHTITNYATVEWYAEDAESRLAAVIAAPSRRAGARYSAVSGDDVANAYKYERQTTHLELLRTSAGWAIVGIHTAASFAHSSRPALTLTPAQDIYAIARLRAKYTVQD